MKMNSSWFYFQYLHIILKKYKLYKLQTEEAKQFPYKINQVIIIINFQSSQQISLSDNENYYIPSILIYKIQMGQVMLESCEMECQRIGMQNKIKNKAEIYFSNMSSQLPQFVHQDQEALTRSKKSVQRNNHFLLEIKQVPTHYIEFVNYLFVEKKKFQDKIFPAVADSIIWGGGQAENDWARLSDVSQEVVRIYRGINSAKKSKILEVLQLIQLNFAAILQNTRPIYINKVGLGICYLYINGIKEQVIVDDLIPTSHLKYKINDNGWHFLIEKAFAKLLGNYAFIEDFTLPQLFQEITGLPFEISKKKGQQWIDRDSSVHLSDMNSSSFKEAIENQKIYYLQGGLQKSDIYSVRIIKGHTIKSASLHSGPHHYSFFKISISKNQKVSIRLSFLNSKFSENTKQQLLFVAQMKLFKIINEQYSLQEKDNYSLLNNIYLGCPFMKIDEGQYILYIKRKSINRKVNLVCYIGDQTSKIKEIHSKHLCKDIMLKINQK